MEGRVAAANNEVSEPKPQSGMNDHCKVPATELHFRKFRVRYELYRSLQGYVLMEGEIMKFLLLLLFLLLTTASYAQTSSLGDEKSPVVVVSAKWLRDRQSVDKVVQSASAPAAALTSADKNYERQKRSNALPGDRDPLLDNVDS